MTLTLTNTNGIVYAEPDPAGDAGEFINQNFAKLDGHLDGVRHAGDFSDADVGDKIMAAIDDLPAAGGLVVVPYGEWDYSSPITVTKNGVRLVGHGLPSRYPNDDVPGTRATFQGTTTSGITLGDGVNRLNGLGLQGFMLACPNLTTGKAIEAKNWVVQAFLRDLYLKARERVYISGFADNGDGKTEVTSDGHGLSNDETAIIWHYSIYKGGWTVEQVTANTFVIDTAFAGDETAYWEPKHGTGLSIGSSGCIGWRVEGVYVHCFDRGIDITGGHYACDYRNCWITGNNTGVRISGGARISFSGGECSDYHYGDSVGFEILESGPVIISDMYSEIMGANSRLAVIGGGVGEMPSMVVFRDTYCNGFSADHAFELKRCNSFRLQGGDYGGPWGISLVKNVGPAVNHAILRPDWYGYSETLVDDTTGVAEMIDGDGQIIYPNLPTADPGKAGALWNSSGDLRISAG